MGEAQRKLGQRDLYDLLVRVVTTGEVVAERQPAAHARTEAEAEAWADFYTALNIARIALIDSAPENGDG